MRDQLAQMILYRDAVKPMNRPEFKGAFTELLDPLDQMVSAPELLRVLWSEESRPSLRWIRTQQKLRVIPFTRRGRRVWFVPRQVFEALFKRGIMVSPNRQSVARETSL